MKLCTRVLPGAGVIHFADFAGEGPPLVLVHGLGGSHLNWMSVAPALARHHRVLVPDLAGFGLTPLAGRSASVEANRALLHAFLEQEVGEPAYLMGNSMGGTLSLMEAALAPEQVRGLILVNPAQPLGKGARLDPAVALRFALHMVPGLGEYAMRRAAQQKGARELVTELLTLCCRDVRRLSPEALEAHVALTARRMAQVPGGYKAYLEASRSLVRFIRRPQAFRQLVHQVRCPTLLVHGVHDRLVAFKSSEGLAQLRPDWRFDVFPELGHVPMLEDPEGFLLRVEDWLRHTERPGVAAAL
jgi:glycerol-3-phosphate dehydrogenase